MTAVTRVSALSDKLAALRADFPILSREIRPGVPLVYLDSAATSQKPSMVIDAESEYYRQFNANVHRGVHTFSEQATSAYEGARRKVRDFIGAAHVNEVIFTRNATEAINLVAYAWGLANLHEGDEIVLTEMEHHANIVPWQIVAGMKGAKVRFIPITPEGRLDLETYPRLLESGRVRMVALGHISNVLGTINPVSQITVAARAAGALTLIDAAQSAPHVQLDVKSLGADFLALSGHKMLAPTGIGVLYGKRALLEVMPPFLGGGSMIDRVTMEGTTFAGLPQRFEAGTPNVGGAVGLSAALDYLHGVGLESIQNHEHALIAYAMEKLAAIPGLVMYGPPPAERTGLVSFTVKGVHPHDLAAMLDNEGIAVRAGHHCAMPLHDKYGVPASVRASFYLYNTFEEVDKLVETVDKARLFFAPRAK